MNNELLLMELREIRKAIVAAGDQSAIFFVLFLIFLAIGPCK